MIKAVIFDMDGTVCDTLDTIAYFANNALFKFGLPAIPTERYKKLVGNGAKTLVERMVAEVGGDMSLVDAVYEQYTKRYHNEFLYLTKPYDGVADMLDTLNSLNVKCAILSNKPDVATKKISTALFGDKISVCRGGVDGIPLKPSPDGVFEIFKELGVSADECLYVGDTMTDMQTGKAAGVFTIGVLWGFRGEKELADNGADLIVSSPSEIVEAAKRINTV